MALWREEMAVAGTTYWTISYVGLPVALLPRVQAANATIKLFLTSLKYTETNLHRFGLLVLLPPYHLRCYWYAVGATAICIVIDDKRMKQHVGLWLSATGRIAGSGQSRGRHSARLDILWFDIRNHAVVSS
jgi:hypothetical protein